MNHYYNVKNCFSEPCTLVLATKAEGHKMDKTDNKLRFVKGKYAV